MDESKETLPPVRQLPEKSANGWKGAIARSSDAVKTAFEGLPSAYKKVSRATGLPVFLTAFQILSLVNSTYRGDPLTVHRLAATAILRDMRSEEHEADLSGQLPVSVRRSSPDTE